MTPSRLLLLSPSFNKQDVPAPLPVIINQPTPSLRGRRNERLRRLDQTRREPFNLLSPTDQERSRSGRLTGRIDQPLAFAIRSTSPFRYLGPGSPNNPAGLSPVCTTKAVSFTTQCSFRFVSFRLAATIREYRSNFYRSRITDRVCTKTWNCWFSRKEIVNCSTRSGEWMDCRVSRIGKFYSDKEFKCIFNVVLDWIRLEERINLKFLISLWIVW